MELMLEFDKYLVGQGFNKWIVNRKDNADCKFPIPNRIEELANPILGSNKSGPKFCGSELRGRNTLILFAFPSADRKTIEKLVTTIGEETKLYIPPI